MKKIEIVKKSEEFEYIIKKNRPFKSEHLNIYISNNEKDINRFGISVTKKTGNAVIRNKIKRRLKDIIDHYEFKIKGYDFIIITKPSIRDLEYLAIKESLQNILDKVLKEKENEKNN